MNSEPTEPKGDCPFCDAPKWHVCDHFQGYVRGDQVTTDEHQKKQGKNGLRPKRADDVAVNTGVSVRAYRKGSRANPITGDNRF